MNEKSTLSYISIKFLTTGKALRIIFLFIVVLITCKISKNYSKIVLADLPKKYCLMFSRCCA